MSNLNFIAYFFLKEDEKHIKSIDATIFASYMSNDLHNLKQQ